MIERAPRLPLLTAAVAVVAFTLFLTWPQALHMPTGIASHDDAYFSMWRLDWIAHALRVDPAHLYDANIYYPERRTLAYSDAMLLEGVVAAPLLWSGLSPVLVYNLMLLGGIALSGLAMFVLARHLTGYIGPALVAAAIFTMAPYRVEHYMHLELQWTMWIPLALWATDRAVREQSWRFGVLSGLFVWLQLVSCVYYGAFLAVVVSLLAVLLVATNRRPTVASVVPLLIGGALAAALAIPYLLPYVENARTLGPRNVHDVRMFSAKPLSYATAPYQNWAWGWTAWRFTGEELRVTPGVVVVLLAFVGAIGWRSRRVLVYAIVGLVAAELSLGLNGVLYSWLLGQLPALGGFRAIARFSIMVLAALSVLAAYGVRYLQERLATSRAREWVAAVAIMLVALEYGSAPIQLTTVPTITPSVYRVIGQLPRGVIAEFPMAEPKWIPGHDPLYQYWSKAHWYPLINGYSGFTSKRYVDTLQLMLTFPDTLSVARLKELDVRYVLVHEALYKQKEFSELMVRMGGRPELVPQGRYRDWLGDTALFELNR